MYEHRTQAKGEASVRPTLPDWSRLCRNDHVQVRFGNGTTVSGTVDMITLDHNVFWILGNDGAGRSMHCWGDDVAVSKVV